MFRSALALLIGFIIGVGLMLLWWPKLPSGHPVSGPADVRVTISGAFLSRAVQAQVAGNDIPKITNVRISSSPPSAIVAKMDLTAGPVTAPATTEMELTADTGRVHVRIVESTVAGIPIPPILTDSVESSIDDRIAHILSGHTKITAVVVHPQGVEIDAVYQ